MNKERITQRKERKIVIELESWREVRKEGRRKVQKRPGRRYRK